MVFGRLVVLREVPTGSKKNHRYLCRCACGRTSTMCGSGLCSKAEPTRSCGCLQRISAMRSPGQAAWRSIYLRYKHRARGKGRDFMITQGEMEQMMSLPCAYCGAAPADYNPYRRKDGTLMPGRTEEAAVRATIKVNGLDRRNSEIGYTVDNCVPCCAQCNYMKLDWTAEEFIAHARRIAAFQDAKDRSEGDGKGKADSGQNTQGT
jgi:hypothetical protein